MQMIDVQIFHKFLRAEFEEEASKDFARLRRVPDTHVKHFVDYYQSLNAADQNALADASTLWGTFALVGTGSPGFREDLNARPALEKWRHEMAMGCGRDPHWYRSVPLLRTCVAQAKIDRAKGKRSSVSKELEEYAASIKSVKAPELRKRVRSVLQPLLGARPLKWGGGQWVYEGTINDLYAKVGIDFGGHYAQLRYDVAVRSPEQGFKFERAGFEVALGAGHGNWDFIVEENLNDSMNLLGEFVKYVADLPRRLSVQTDK